MARKIKLRTDLHNVWEDVNPVLGGGELGVVKDKNTIKVGDGNTNFNDLPELAKDPDVVHKSGDETIDGVKTFNDKVGIGVDDPDEKLEVDGDVKINDNLIYHRGHKVYNNSSNDLEIHPNHGDRLILQSDNEVRFTTDTVNFKNYNGDTIGFISKNRLGLDYNRNDGTNGRTYISGITGVTRYQSGWAGFLTAADNALYYAHKFGNVEMTLNGEDKTSEAYKFFNWYPENISIGDSSDELVVTIHSASYLSRMVRVGISQNIGSDRYASNIKIEAYDGDNWITLGETDKADPVFIVANDHNRKKLRFTITGFKGSQYGANIFAYTDGYKGTRYLGTEGGTIWGDIGIGTDNPASKLEVVGETRLNGKFILGGGTNTYIVEGYGFNTHLGNSSSYKFRIYTDDLEIFRARGDGTINMPNLPTSSDGLSAGDIWIDGTTLKIVT